MAKFSTGATRRASMGFAGRPGFQLRGNARRHGGSAETRTFEDAPRAPPGRCASSYPEVGRTLRPDLLANQRGEAAAAKIARSPLNGHGAPRPVKADHGDLADDDRRATRPTNAGASRGCAGTTSANKATVTAARNFAIRGATSPIRGRVDLRPLTSGFSDRGGDRFSLPEKRVELVAEISHQWELRQALLEHRE
jgi:hypothetical protein